MKERSKLVYSTDGPENLEKPGRESGPAPGDKKSKTQKLHLRLERKGRGGKTVTLVCGLNSIEVRQLSGSGMEALLKEMKARLGTGGALKGDVLELQGDHRDAITAMLREKGLNI